MSFSSEKGQSLLEVVIALAVVGLVIMALIRVTVISVRNAAFARNQVLATKYAQEWLEEARNWRDQQDPEVFFVDGSCNAGPEAVDIFTRTRTCSLSVEGDKKTMTVVVEVSWTDAVGDHQSRLETRLTNWR